MDLIPNSSPVVSLPASPRPKPDRPWVLSPTAIVAAPLIAVLASCADVIFIVARHGRFQDLLADLTLRTTVLATVPLSIAAGLWTFYMLIRMRREVLRRDQAEVALRTALSQREKALEREFAVRRELDHRVRNNLAGLVGLVGVYERSGRSPAQLGQAIRTKIEAMRGVHDIASRAGGGPVDLQSLLALVADSIVPAQRRTGLLFGGPQTPIATGQAGAMAMILQELCTNSVKHGALSAGGTVRVHWTAVPAPEGTSLALRWAEQGVPDTHDQPAIHDGSGVGLGLIAGFARSDLRGDVLVTRTAGAWIVEIRALLAPPTDSDHARALSEAFQQEVCA